MTSILTWNVKGLNSPNNQRELAALCRNKCSHVWNRLEIKVRNVNVTKVAKNLCRGWGIQLTIANTVEEVFGTFGIEI